MSNSERNVNIDLIRVIAMLLVIAIHTRLRPMADSALAQAILMAVLFFCNSAFFMISGGLNIKKTFSSAEDIRQFWLKKAITILFPLLFMIIFLYIWDIIDGDAAFSFKTLYEYIMGNGPYGHLWYMYYLIGFILSTPILSKAFNTMDRKALNMIFVACIAWNVLSIFLTKDIGVNFAYTGWIMSGWATVYFAGYYIDRNINDGNKKTLYILGIAGFAVTVLGSWIIPEHYYNKNDLSPAYIAFTMALYVFLLREIKIKNKYFAGAIKFIAKYSFIIYLVHWNVLYKITPHFINQSAGCTAQFFEMIIITFVLCLAVAFVLETVILTPCKMAMLKLLNRRTGESHG